MRSDTKAGAGTIVAGLFLVALAAWWGYILLAGPHFGGPQATAVPPGKAASPLAITTSHGSVSLADLKGKVVLVDFWATWCPPCRESIPHVEALYRKYRDRGFEVLGASVDDTDGVIPPFARQMGITYPVGRLVDPQVTGSYGVGGIPTMVLIDKRGAVRWRGEGFGAKTESDLASHIESLLAEAA